MRHLAILLAASSLALAQDLTVQTAEGPVAGTLVSSGVRQFLGIPYATVTRWAPPQPAAVRDATFEATAFGDSCVQELSTSNKEFLTLIGLGAQNVQESEDCLSLNIWAPSTDRAQNTAVMLFIYGGGFEFGTSNTVYYTGQNIVGNNDDVLVVTINYRTNIFGFPGAPQLSGSSQTQNFGALDVDAAIQWVHDNIAAFGGDPERMILFGQSAGSGMIAQYTFANPTDTRVKGVIQQSGSLAGLTTDLTAFGGPLDPSSWNTVASAVGCGSDDTDDQLNCMKGIDFRTLENAVINADVDFVPIQDGITFFSDVTDRSSQGNFLRVPMLVGNTNQEGDIFVVGAEQTGLGVDIPGVTTLASPLVTKVVFSCPAGTTAGDRVKAGVPTWRYRYDGVFPDISTQSDLRAFHASELPVLFGTSADSPFGPPTPQQNALSLFMQAAWVAFARDPQNGLTNFGFPPYNPNTNSLVILGGSSNISGASFTSGSSYDSGCSLSELGASLALKLVNALGGIF